MAGEDAPPPTAEVDPDRVAGIVSSYVRHHQIAPDELPALIVEVHRALANLGRDTPPVRAAEPAVSIRRSVQQDYIVCLECGFRAQMLRRHLRVAHGLEIADYRARWKLPADYPLTAPNYSARRATLAKEISFGHYERPTPSPPATERPMSRRRGRPPRRPPPAT